MKFRIATTDYLDPDKVVMEYPCLRKYEFEDGYVTIHTLEQLMELVNDTCGDQYGLVLFKSTLYSEGCPFIEIYDNWRE